MPSTATKPEFYSSGFPKQMNRTKFDLPISKRLKEARARKKLTLSEVVQRLKERGLKTGVSTIQGYEQLEDNINHRYPPLHTLMLLIEIYECSADFIFDFSDEPERSKHDLHQELFITEKINWQGTEITEGQRGLLQEKINEIMSI